MRCRSSKARGGFTIVELLVAAGVSLLLMVIITEAFKRGIDMFRTMRAQGVMQERLRTAGTAIRDDLASFHFPDDSLTKTQYVSDQTADNGPTQPYLPPDDGFFRIFQGPMDPATNNPFVVEGTDRDGMLFTRATTHILHMTVLRLDFAKSNQGATPENMFRVPEPAQTVGLNVFPRDYTDPLDYGKTGYFTSRFAEVAYFLTPNGNSAGNTPLFNLIRRQQLVIPRGSAVPNSDPPPTGTGVPVPVATPANPEISTRYTLAPANYYNNTKDVTQPRNRFGMAPAGTAAYPTAADPNAAGIPSVINNATNPPYFGYQTLANSLGATSARAGDDIILADVISFEVKALWTPIALNGITDPAPSPAYTIPGLGTKANSDYPFDYLPVSTRNNVLGGQKYRVFDTWSHDDIYAGWNGGPSGVAIPLRINLKAVLIRIRIWDPKAEQARQLTIIQDV